MTSARRLAVTGAIVVGLSAPAVAVGNRVVAQEAGPAHPAHVHIGTCAELGEIAAPLPEVAPKSGGLLAGSDQAVPILASTAEVAIPLFDLLAAPHAINIHQSADEIQTYVACGDIGGRIDGEELVIGIRELGGSGLSGVAVLEADDDVTEVAVYLTQDGAGAAAPAAADAAPTVPPVVEVPASAPTEAPAAAPTEAPIEPAAEEAAGQEVAVDIRDFAFDPATIEIAVGDTITWTNRDAVPHTATANDRDVLQSGVIAPDGGSFSQTFEAAGEFPYFCEFHPNMEGTIVVE